MDKLVKKFSKMKVRRIPKKGQKIKVLITTANEPKWVKRRQQMKKKAPLGNLRKNKVTKQKIRQKRTPILKVL